jgi:hypothetical protein
MAKQEGKKTALAAIDETPGAERMTKRIAQRRKWLGAAAEKATKDGTLDASDAKYRTARKRVKRAQRRLRRERARVARVRVKTGTPAAEGAAG